MGAATGFGSRAPAPARVLVHCGFRKAGSTSIQRMLRLNVDALAPKIDVFARTRLTKDIRKAAMGYVAPVRRTELAAIGLLAQRMRRRLGASAGKTVVISDENIFGNSLYRDDGTDIFDWAAAILPLVETALDDCNPEFVLYTRNKNSWLQSAYSQAVMRSGAKQDFDAWIAPVRDRFDWDEGLGRVRKALKAPVHVVDMDAEIATGALLGSALLTAAGLGAAEIATLKPAGTRNRSISPAGLKFMRLVNDTSLSTAQTKEIYLLVKRNQKLFRGS